MDDKTLREEFLPNTQVTIWDSLTDASGFSYDPHAQELYYDPPVFPGHRRPPIAFPRTLKAARHIIKEMGWNIA